MIPDVRSTLWTVPARPSILFAGCMGNTELPLPDTENFLKRVSFFRNRPISPSPCLGPTTPPAFFSQSVFFSFDPNSANSDRLLFPAPRKPIVRRIGRWRLLLFHLSRFTKFFFHLFNQKHLQQRLIRDVSLVCQYFEMLKQGFWQSDRDRPCRRFQAGEQNPFAFGIINILRRIMGRPESNLFFFILELWQLFHFLHRRFSFLCCSCLWQK